MISSQAELERFLQRKSRLFQDALMDLAEAHLGLRDYNTASAEVAELLRSTLILSNLYGRKRMLMEADAVRRNSKFSTVPQLAIPQVDFEEAIEDLVSREPRLAKSSIELSRMYNTEHVFGMVRSIDLHLTARVQEAIGKFMREGVSAPEATQIIAEMGPFTRSYAECVYETNLSEAYTAGRFEQAKDPDVADVVPAMMYVSEDDSVTRPNHRAGHGMIAATDDPIWNVHKPPQGYRCRCGCEFVSVYELERRNLIRDGKVVRYLPPTWPQAHPDKGFKVGAT